MADVESSSSLGFSIAQIKRFGGLDSFPAGGSNVPRKTGEDAHDRALFEVEMDIKLVGSIAPGSYIVVYLGASGGIRQLKLALDTAVRDSKNKPSVICVSCRKKYYCLCCFGG